MMQRTFLVVCLLFSFSAFGQLPDARLTPGVVRGGVSLHQICTTKWSRDVRHVTDAMKREVFAAYGMKNTVPPCPCEIDHLISRELGGADDVKNLWPQPYTGLWNARMKDRLENRLHKEVCAGQMELRSAQGQISENWTKLFQKFFGEPI